MLRLSIRRAISVLPWAVALAAGLSSPGTVLAENVIRGTAENLSSSQPAAGDDVFLLGMDRAAHAGAQPRAAARTKTDAQGAFLLPVPAPGTTYLVRVVHQGVAYEQQGSAGSNLSIAVFDARPRVPAITGTIEILRLGTRGSANQKLLHVSDMLEIRNQSNPPITEAGDSTVEVYLPGNAKIDSVLAAGPSPGLEGGQEAVHEEIGQTISATPVAGKPGHYTVNFPLLPGATRFAFNYDLPYQSHALFETRRQYGFQEFAVMMPRAMRFSSPSSAFRPLPIAGSEYQVQAVTQLKAGEGPEFEVSGDGPLPSLRAPGKARAEPHSPVLPSSAGNQSVPALPAAVSRSGRKSEEVPSRWPWLALAGCFVLACILVLLGRRGRRPITLERASAGVGGPRRAPASSLERVKEELFQLEIDRVCESISSEEYSSARVALERIVKRAALRAGDGGRMIGVRSRKAGKT